MWALELCLGVLSLLLLCMAVLWVVMPGGVEPGTKGRLMWGNLFPWINHD